MRRTVLLSFLMIAASLSVVFGAGTFAPFTSTDTISGEVTSGKLVIDLLDGDDGETTVLTFDTGVGCGELTPALSPDPAEICSTEIDVKNDDLQDSNLEFTYTGTVTESDDVAADCFTATLVFVSNAASGADGSVTNASVGTTGAADTGAFSIVELAASDGANADALDPTEVDTYRLDVSLQSSDASCQDLTVTYTFVVNATQSTSPHD